MLVSDQANAFVLPGGKVFVYSGIFPVCKNNDGLAAVMGHEIAHNMAQHAAEKMSQMALLQPIVWGLMYLDYTGVTMGLGRFLGSMMLDLGIMRVSSREQESEADHIGLMLMAAACYDPKEAVGLWERMERLDKETPPEWLSTHPSVCFLPSLIKLSFHLTLSRMRIESSKLYNYYRKRKINTRRATVHQRWDTTTPLNTPLAAP